jgi:site-specific DNA-methyltransferase (adenine-specific)
VITRCFLFGIKTAPEDVMSLLSMLGLLLKNQLKHFITQTSKRNNIRIHPTQKPVSLYEWLLMNYAKEGDKILDTHLGSGSIAIACHNLGFDLTACELDKDYYEAALKRIEQHQSQQRLF